MLRPQVTGDTSPVTAPIRTKPSAWSNTETITIDATAPTITSSATFSINENQTAVGTVTATDAGSGRRP